MRLTRGSFGGRRAALVLGLLIAIVVLLVLALARPRRGPTSGTSPVPAGTPYFLAHRDHLSEPSRELREVLSVRLASWETSTALGKSRPPRWLVLVENRHPERPIKIADVIVEPTPATAPGSSLRHDGFTTALLRPGEIREIELVTPLEAAPELTPPPSPEPETYGVRVFVVAAFADRSGLPSPLPTPADAEGFRDAWGEFALVEDFSAIPPDLLRLSPPG